MFPHLCSLALRVWQIFLFCLRHVCRFNSTIKWTTTPIFSSSLSTRVLEAGFTLLQIRFKNPVQYYKDSIRGQKVHVDEDPPRVIRLVSVMLTWSNQNVKGDWGNKFDLKGIWASAMLPLWSPPPNTYKRQPKRRRRGIPSFSYWTYTQTTLVFADSLIPLRSYQLYEHIRLIIYIVFS